MLESNTDRSYFMIGAVIVAALLIGAALFIFGNGDHGVIGSLKKSITDLFSTASGAASHVQVNVPQQGQ